MSTIAAIATAPGTGGIAVIRISGSGARAALEAIFQPLGRNFRGFRPWVLHYGKFLDGEGIALDEGLAVFMPGPATFTGEDVAELHCHGGQLIVETVLQRLFELGCQPAERGEFTRRAFLNGRMDLTQAEAVAEIIAARSPVALRQGLDKLAGHLALRVRKLKEQIDELRALMCLGLDFPDDEIDALEPAEVSEKLAPILENLYELLRHGRRARLFRQLNRIVLAGPVNSGKSSLLNALAGRERALVSASPGTTRDYLEAELDFNGLPVCLVDTAGLRQEAADPVEMAGMKKSRELLREADLVWLVLDSSVPEDVKRLPEFLGGMEGLPLLLVWNKADLAEPPQAPDCRQLAASALTGANLKALVEESRQILLQSAGAEDEGVAPNARQAALLAEAAAELEALKDGLAEALAYDLCSSRLDMAAAKLNGILGLAPHDELLDAIFSRFCIGK